MHTASQRLIVACGGTGGHVFPGIAMAHALRQREYAVELWLAGHDIEQSSAFAWDGPVVRMPARGLPAGRCLQSAWKAAGLLLTAGRCVGRMRRGPRPVAVLAMGGFASVGPGLAARWLRIPLVLHEANAIPGRAITMLSRWAAAVAVAFPEAANYFHGVPTTVTGFPLRQPDPLGTDDFDGALPLPAAERFTILVAGGSQGAHRLNELSTQALCALNARKIPFQVIHLAGHRDADQVRDRYTRAGVPAAVFGFLRRMDRAYAAAHLAVCRAGAATCAELAAAGVPALLVPYPSAARDHQTANAMAVARAGAADWIAEDQIQVAWLTDYLAGHAAAPEKLHSMRTAALGRAVRDADQRTARVVTSTR